MFATQELEGDGNPPQLAAGQPDTSVATLGIDGNDIGFSSIIDDRTAVTPNGPVQAGPPPYQYDSCEDKRNGYDELADRIDDTQEKVENVLVAPSLEVRETRPGIQDRAPGPVFYSATIRRFCLLRTSPCSRRGSIAGRSCPLRTATSPSCGRRRSGSTPCSPEPSIPPTPLRGRASRSSWLHIPAASTTTPARTL